MYIITIILLLQNLCDLDMRTSPDDQTPLHIAVHKGHSAVVERLVGFGADVNATDIRGNTVLHLSLTRGRFVPPNECTPQLLKVKIRYKLCIYLHTSQAYTYFFE